MATIDYKCDTCKRNITLAENPLGMTVFAKCIITEGCKGTLYKLARNENIAREVSDFPPAVLGLNDYVKRRAFYPELINITSNPWKIKHNLGTSPAVTVYILDNNDDTSELSPDEYIVTVVDKDNIEIAFNSPQRGLVHLVARSSVPIAVVTVADNGNLFQVSNGGFMDFASVSVINTLSGQQFLTEDDFDLQIEVQIPSSPLTTVEGVNELLKDQLNSSSPWFGWEQVLVRKRRNFATKNMQILEAFQLAFGSSIITNLTDVPNGSSFVIQKIRYRNVGTGYLGEFIQLEPRSLLLLLANSPYGVVDKIRNQVIDVGELPLATNGRFFIYDGEVFLNQDNIERIYPRLEQASTDNLLNTPTPSPTISITPTITVTPSTTVPASASATPTPTPSPLPELPATRFGQGGITRIITESAFITGPSTNITFAFWMKKEIGGNDATIFAGGGVNFLSIIGGQIYFSWPDDTGGTVAIETITVTAPSPISDSAWHHVVLSFDTTLADGFQHILVDGVDQPLQSSPIQQVGVMVDHDGYYGIGTNLTQTLPFYGCITQFYHTNEYIDLGVPANVAKFIGPSGEAISISASSPTGTAAAIFLNGDDTTFLTNLGSSVNITAFIEWNGVITACPSGPNTIGQQVTPTPTPTVSNTPGVSVTPGASITPSNTPNPTTATPTPAVSNTPGISISASPTPTGTPMGTTSTPTPTPSVTQSISLTPTVTPGPTSATPTPTPTITPSTSVAPVILIPWGNVSTTVISISSGTTVIQSGHVITGGVGTSSAGTWRRETGPPFDTPVGPWWSQGATDITTAPLSLYQDFYVYFKFISSNGSPSFLAGSESFGGWHSIGATTREQIIEDDGTPVKQVIYDPYMIYSPGGAPAGDPSVSPPAGTVFMGRVTLLILSDV